MAQRVQVQLIDDITGEEAEETITFGLDGITYEIELTAENARQLREQLRPYLESGRRTSGRAGSRQRSETPGSKDDVRRIRQWARENGYKLSDRGRISRGIVEAYRMANA